MLSVWKPVFFIPSLRFKQRPPCRQLDRVRGALSVGSGQLSRSRFIGRLPGTFIDLNSSTPRAVHPDWESKLPETRLFSGTMQD